MTADNILERYSTFLSFISWRYEKDFGQIQYYSSISIWQNRIVTRNSRRIYLAISFIRSSSSSRSLYSPLARRVQRILVHSVVYIPSVPTSLSKIGVNPNSTGNFVLRIYATETISDVHSSVKNSIKTLSAFFRWIYSCWNRNATCIRKACTSYYTHVWCRNVKNWFR